MKNEGTVKFLQSIVWEGWSLLFVDIVKDIISVPHHIKDIAEQLFSAELIDELRKRRVTANEPVLFLEKDIPIYYWTFTYEGHLFVLGPISLQSLSDEHRKRFSYRRQNADSFPIRNIPLKESLGIFLFLLEGISGNQLNFSEILTSNTKCANDRIEYTLIHYKADELVSGRLSYKAERRWLDLIRQGKDINQLEEVNGADLSYIGILARDNPLKQIEYMVVAKITLATRAAIEGGLAPIVPMNCPICFCSSAHWPGMP